ncbi:hypothetical protein EVAR_95933_1 [Eumeta japonica]|uniref:Uncharacterized protein n=1 Tax=Eumeta variegata TaxID=151549 RepID=A0A4C1V804_EUMVA|nr:hypothetical protein EVAR_95933_1 [Eumeta japonica]
MGKRASESSEDRRSTPPMGTRNPRGVPSALSTSQSRAPVPPAALSMPLRGDRAGCFDASSYRWCGVEWSFCGIVPFMPVYLYAGCAAFLEPGAAARR